MSVHERYVLPVQGFRFFLRDEGICFEATDELRDALQASFSAYASGPRRAYDGIVFSPSLHDAGWGFGGVIQRLDGSPEGRSTWIARWPQVPPIPGKSALRYVSASLSVLRKVLLLKMRELGWIHDQAPVLLPNLMMPETGMNGAALDAEFAPRIRSWITVRSSQDLDEVATAMRTVAGRLMGHEEEYGRHGYLARVDLPGAITLGIPQGSCTCMYVTHGNEKEGLIKMVSHNVDTVSYQLVLLAGLIAIAELYEAWERSREHTMER